MKKAETPAQIAGRYEVTGRIGSGGMGDVLRARDTVLNRNVALKMLPFELAVQPGFVDRFRAEAQSVAKISHPNVVQVHDWGQEEDTYFMVMEYVRGKNLRQILNHYHKLPPRQATQIIGQVVGALAAAHEKGVVHRDVKPENVLLSTEGRAKVTDFGIARAIENAAATKGMLGTVAYVSPEQARGEAVDPRTDLYSAGCMMFELLTGSLPFEGDAAKVLQDHLNSQVPAPSKLNPDLDPALDEIVLKATAPDPEERFSSAAEMRSALASVLKDLPAAPPLNSLMEEFTSETSAEAQQTIVGHLGSRKPRRRPWRLLALGAVLVALVVGGVAFYGPTQVPDVTGVSQEVAEERLSQAGLDAEFAEVFSADVPLGDVVDSRPGPGAWTSRGGSVSVSVSKGPKLTNVPDVVGTPLDQAREAILGSELAMGNVERRNSIEPVDTVLEQDPEPKQVKSGDLVNLVVSDGPAILPIPDLSGRSASEAQQLLQEAGFGSRTEEVFNAAEAGLVVGQEPSPGGEHPQGTQVTVRVSKGPEPFAVPDVRGKTCSVAKTELEGLGLTVRVQSASGAAVECGGTSVLEQDPLADSRRTAGAEATLYVGG